MNSLQISLRKSAASWRSQAIHIRLIRLWLGVTWIYAGWDKASDSGFLTQGSPTYIGTQLAGFAAQSPVGSLFNTLIEHAHSMDCSNIGSTGWRHDVSHPLASKWLLHQTIFLL